MISVIELTILLVESLLEQDTIDLHLVNYHIAAFGADNDLGLGLVLCYAPYGAAY